MEKKPYQCKIETYWRIVAPIECRIKPCEGGDVIIRKKIPFKWEIVTYWRIETIEMQLYERMRREL